MRVTAEDLKQLGVIERVVPEPLGGAHRNSEEAIATLGSVIEEELARYDSMSGAEIRAERRQKFLNIA
jgi:acetyl-CoA carboxylase carboxyl transferase subunit alpha